ncbi:MAG: RIP metalloprotease RseP [Rhodobacter sp.]|nr:RIP metalloprotease RseP [Rhodobacter sp.]
MVDLIPTFGNALYTIGAFIIALSIIVAVHEYGHYIVGRWCGIKAEVFSIGFGPVLWAKSDRHGTQWQIAALPFGGFVKFLGDAGAVSDRASDDYDQLDPETKRHTMHGAPLWARVLTVAAGPVFNFILSIIIFTGFVMSIGVATQPVTVSGMKPVPEVFTPLQPGDVILELEGQAVSSPGDLTLNARELPQQATLTYLVERDGARQQVEGPFPLLPMIGAITPNSAADSVGLAEGDVILSIDGEPIQTFFQLQERAIASEGRTLLLEVWRGGELLEFSFNTKLGAVQTENGMEERWLIGMTGDIGFELETRTPGLLEAAGYGVERTYGVIAGSLTGLYSMISGAIGTCNLSGPVGIAKTSGSTASQGLDSFIWFIAVLSTAVGLLNLFPIPVLDGGHLVFHAYEAVRGRPPSDRALRILMAAGLAVLLTLMIFALSNDLFCP